MCFSSPAAIAPNQPTDKSTGRGAFVSREDVARTAAAVLRKQPGGIYDVTGPEALSVADIARRLSTLVGRQLRYEDESADAARERLSRLEPLAWFQGTCRCKRRYEARCTGGPPRTGIVRSDNDRGRTDTSSPERLPVETDRRRVLHPHAQRLETRSCAAVPAHPARQMQKLRAPRLLP